MILMLYAFLFALTIILIIIGYFTGAPVLQIGAYTFMFILGLIMMIGGLQYNVGETSQTVFNYDNGTLMNQSLILNQTYESFNNEIVMGIDVNHLIGFLITVLALLGFVSTMEHLGNMPSFGREKDV